MPIYEQNRAIVVDPKSDRFGQTGEILVHNSHAGIFRLGFPDGSQVDFRDGLLDADPLAPQALMLGGVVSTIRVGAIQSQLIQDRSRLQSLADETANGITSRDLRLRAKQAFLAIVQASFDAAQSQ